MSKLLLFLLLLSSSVLALKPHTATYTLSMLDFEIATEQRILSKKNNNYHYLAHAKTTGLASIIKDYEIKAESSFTISQFGIYSSHYKYFERDGKKIKKDIDIKLKNQQIDPLSLFLALADALAKNPKQTDFYFTVNNGKQTEQQHYQQVANDNPNLIKIINPAKQIEAYFAKHKNYLPISVNKKKFSYKLDSVSF